MEREKINYLQYQVRRRRLLNSHLQNRLRIIDKSIPFYYEDIDSIQDKNVIASNLRCLRNFDELKAFVEYNSKLIIQEDANFSHEVLSNYIDTCIELYNNDEVYLLMKGGQNPLDVSSPYVSELTGKLQEYTFGFKSIKECLENDENIDFNGQETLKRILFSSSVLEEDFISTLESKSMFSALSKEEVIKEIKKAYDIITEYVYPNYLYIDSEDVKEMVEHLMVDAHLDRGFFGPVKVSTFTGRTNTKRKFVISRQ